MNVLSPASPRSHVLLLVPRLLLTGYSTNAPSHSQRESQQPPSSGGGGGGGGKLPGGVSRMVFPFLLFFFGFNSFLPGLNPGRSSVSTAPTGPSSPGCSVKGKNSSPGYGKE